MTAAWRTLLTSAVFGAVMVVSASRVAKTSSPGTDAVIEFRAQTRGSFTFYCRLTGDPRCRGMKGQLVVR